jgi:hypothetical protein
MRTLIVRSRSLGPDDIEAAVSASPFAVTKRLLGDRGRTRAEAEAFIGVWDGESEEVRRAAAWAHRAGIPATSTWCRERSSPGEMKSS